ncbi:MAG: arginine repressor [Clostridia bacterium]|nr:arginine repressor [Clostridia bacterium]
MKKKRLAKIMQLIEQYDVENQDVLIKLLQKEGFQVTQATVSRDIKELDLIKVVSGYGGYKYVKRERNNKKSTDKYIAIFRESVTGIDFAGNMVVVKCHNGMANAACAAIDTMQVSDILGTIAGDDTIFAVCSNEKAAQTVCEKIDKLIVS